MSSNGTLLKYIESFCPKSRVKLVGRLRKATVATGKKRPLDSCF